MKKLFESFRSWGQLKEWSNSESHSSFIEFAKGLSPAEDDEDLASKIALIHEFIMDSANGFKRIGGGAFRTAYKAQDGEVIKVVRSPNHFKAAIAQNLAEIKAFNTPANSEITPRVYESDPDGVWFVIEEVDILGAKNAEGRMDHKKMKKVLEKNFPVFFETFPYVVENMGATGILSTLSDMWSTNLVHDLRIADLADKKGLPAPFRSEVEREILYMASHEIGLALMPRTDDYKAGEEETIKAYHDIEKYLRKPDKKFMTYQNFWRTYDIGANYEDKHSKSLVDGNPGTWGVDADDNLLVTDLMF